MKNAARRWAGLAFALIASGLAACGGDADDSAGLPVLVTDSAGVSIIVAESLDSLVGYVLTGPLVDLASSSEPGEGLFSRVRTAHRLPDGRVVVADGGDRRLEVFDAEGTSLGSLGNPDHEYLAVSAIWTASEARIAVYDGRRRDISLQPLDGGRIETIEVGTGLPNDNPIGRLASGEALFRRLDPNVAETGFDTTRVAILRLPAAGGAFDTLGVWSGSRMGRVGEPPVQLVTRPMFEPPFVAAAAGERFVTADCRSPEYRVHDRDGKLVSVARWAAEPIRVTDDDVRVFRAQRLNGLDPRQSRSARQVLDALPVNREFPACDRLLMDDGGRTWVRAFRRPADTHSSWLVFNPEGRPLFSLLIPGNARVVSVDHDHVTLIENNLLDVPRVRVYAIEQP